MNTYLIQCGADGIYIDANSPEEAIKICFDKNKLHIDNKILACEVYELKGAYRIAREITLTKV